MQKFHTAMEIAISSCMHPKPRCCGAPVKMEIASGSRLAYHDSIRAVCGKCGRASGWVDYDAYEIAMPRLWNVIARAYDDFLRGEHT